MSIHEPPPPFHDERDMEPPQEAHARYRPNDMPHDGDEFCMIHGREFMRAERGNPIPYCAACEAQK